MSHWTVRLPNGETLEYDVDDGEASAGTHSTVWWAPNGAYLMAPREPVPSPMQPDPDPLTVEEAPPEPSYTRTRLPGCGVLVVLVVLLAVATPSAVPDKPGFLEGLARTPALRSGPHAALPGFRAQAEASHAQPNPRGSSTRSGTWAYAKPSYGPVTGWASWFDIGPGMYAAAGPLLRKDDWRGSLVRVTSGDKAVTVRLTDWCACGDRHGKPTAVDLSRDAFAVLADPALGIVEVTVESDVSSMTLPQTDMEARQ